MFLRLKGTDRVQEAVGLYAEQLLATGEWEPANVESRPLMPEDVKQPYEVAAVAPAPETAVVPRPVFRRG